VAIPGSRRVCREYDRGAGELMTWYRTSLTKTSETREISQEIDSKRYTKQLGDPL